MAAMAAFSLPPAVMTFNYPFKTLEELRNNSPSRQHGLTAEQEERWKRSAINLIVQTTIQLGVGSITTLGALELLHRYYAEYSMVTNDRFLISIACVYLAGKLWDTPKSSRDIISAALLCMYKDPSEVRRLTTDREWMAAAREKVNAAERALLYQVGFRFSQNSPMQALAKNLGSEPFVSFLQTVYPTEEERNKQFVQPCGQVVLQSAKVPLVLQYSPEAIAAGCAWMAMKMLKLDTTPLRCAGKRQQPWYCDYGLTDTDLKSISEQITQMLLSNAAAGEELKTQAVSVAAEVVVPPPSLGTQRMSYENERGPGGAGGSGGGSQNGLKGETSYDDLLKELDQ